MQNNELIVIKDGGLSWSICGAHAHMTSQLPINCLLCYQHISYDIPSPSQSITVNTCG